MKVTAPEESVIRDIGHAFGYYDCGEERGPIDAFPSREAVAAFICGYVRMALQSGMLYTTSEKQEGFIAFRRPGEKAGLRAGLCFVKPTLGVMRLRDRILKEGQVQLLTYTLEKYFYDQLFRHIRSQAAVHGTEYAALRCFMEVHGIHVEQADIDKLYKNYRDRKAHIRNQNLEKMRTWYLDHGHTLAPLTPA